MKIRIFALAKELNLDSKDLIEACARVGIILKNSALASITPEEKDKVLEHLNSSKGGGAESSSAKAPVNAPQRDVPKNFGAKMRDIRDMAPVANPGRGASLQRQQEDSLHGAVAMDDELVGDGEEPQVAVMGDESGLEDSSEPMPETPEVISESETEAPGPESTFTSSDSDVPVIATSTPLTSVSDSSVTAASSPESQADTSLPIEGSENIPASEDDSESGEKGEGASKGSVAKALRQEDYIAPSGVRHNMVARGTVDIENVRNQQAQQRVTSKSKSRSGPNLPSLANLGNYKAPTSTAPQEKAQKPDMKFPVAALNAGGSALQGFIASKKKEDDKKKADAAAGQTPKKRTQSVLQLAEQEAEEAQRKKGVKSGAGKVVGADLASSRKERQSKRSRDFTGEEDRDGGSRFRPKPTRRAHASSSLKTSAEIEPPITIRSLSEAMGRPANQLIKSLFLKGVQATINSPLEEETALELAMECGVDLQIIREKDLEEELFAGLDEEVPAGEHFVTRPPLVTILGHVDHGKTTLLDTIRKANVAAGEAGGITQHIAAYQVEHHGKKITFVDTPGHAAFSEMRARGADVTDIVVLVVAANDGVMPQTVEAISHAKAAGVPIIVAMNKIDLPSVNEQRVLQELAAQNILASEWGGDVDVVRTSGLTGKGIDDLLETILLTAELHDYKVDPDAQASGVCLEAFLDEGRGTVAWLMVQRGTLRIGDVIICGEAFGRIRNMYNDRGEEIEEAPASTPIKVSGLDVVPSPGDKFVAVEDLESARQVAEERRTRERAKLLASKVKPRTLEDVVNLAKGSGVRDLPLIVKADTPGSIEAIRFELDKFSHPEVQVKLVHAAVGGVNESDIYLATATGAIIVAFHVIPEDRAKILADREGVEIREYSIIYEVTDHIKKALEGLLRPDVQQVSTGRAIVLRTFFISRVGGTVAGCRVLNGAIDRNNRVRVIREHRILNDYAIGSLKREKDDVREVREGYECGIRLENFNDVKEGDLLEAYRIEEVKRTL